MDNLDSYEFSVDWRDHIDYYVSYHYHYTYSSWFLSHNNEKRERVICNNWSSLEFNKLLTFLQNVDNLEFSFEDDPVTAYTKICLFYNNIVPKSINDAQNIMSKTFVSIYDYIQGIKRIFSNRQQLINHCNEYGYYPKKQAKSQNLKILLQHLLQ